MSLLRLCGDDPLVRLLREVFDANIVRIPDGRVQPLSVIAHSGGQTRFRGALAPLLAGETVLDDLVTSTPIAAIAGRRSRRVALDLGLHILRGLFAGLGIPTSGLATTLHGVGYLAFAFPAVERSAADINQLGNRLSGQRLRRDNPALAPYLTPGGGELLLIDSIFSSSSLVVYLGSGSDRELRLDLYGLERLIAGTGVGLTLTDTPATALSLVSPCRLTFAFSCVRLFCNAAGQITALPPDLQARTLGDAPARAENPNHVLLSTQPGLLMWDS